MPTAGRAWEVHREVGISSVGRSAATGVTRVPRRTGPQAGTTVVTTPMATVLGFTASGTVGNRRPYPDTRAMTPTPAPAPMTDATTPG